MLLYYMNLFKRPEHVTIDTLLEITAEELKTCG